MDVKTKQEIDRLSLVNKAICIATLAHADQTRKGSDIPYITHPVACAMLAQQYTDDPEIIIACLLHDVLEDVSPTIYSKTKMLEDFGEGVVGLVEAVSEPKIAGETQKKPWQERKDAYFERLEQTDDKRAMIVSCADKICNLNDILNDYKIEGEKLWEKFKADKKSQWWFYKQCYEEAEDNENNVPYEMRSIFKGLLSQLKEILGARITSEETWRELPVPEKVLRALEEAQEIVYQELEDYKPLYYIKHVSMDFDYDGKTYHLRPAMFGAPDALFETIMDDIAERLEKAGCTNIIKTTGVLD